MLHPKLFYNEYCCKEVCVYVCKLIFQAQHFHDDSLRVNSLILGQTSVELKRARSLVRVQEIQATLHEQRYDIGNIVDE